MIIRRKITENFTILSQAVFNDRRLSAEALGVLCFLRSLPDDWTVSQEHLRERFNCGRHKMQGIIKELIETGWMERMTVRKAGRGTFASSDYVVNDKPKAQGSTPQTENRAAVETAAEALSPQIGFPAAEEPATENRPAYQESTLTQDSSPLNPPTGGGLQARKLLRGNGVSVPAEPRRAANREPALALEGEAAERFERLEAAYPEAAKGATKPDQARAIFAAMSDEDQVLAIGAAASYAATLVKTGHSPKGLHGWLSQRRFLNFRPATGLAKGSAPIGATSTAPARVFVELGTPGWDAWAAHGRSRGESGSYPTMEKAGHRNPGWHFPSAMPPADGPRAA